MNKSLREFYEKKNPIAAMGITNISSIQILDIEYGIDDYAIIKGFAGDIHRYKIYYSVRKGMYFKYGNTRYYLKHFLKI